MTSSNPIQAWTIGICETCGRPREYCNGMHEGRFIATAVVPLAALQQQRKQVITEVEEALKLKREQTVGSLTGWGIDASLEVLATLKGEG